MQVTGSLITGTVNVGQVPGGGAHTGAGGHTLLPLSAVTLVYSTGASSTAGTANLTFSNKFQGYVTQVTINGSSKSVFVWTGGAYITYGTCFAAGTYGGVAIPAGVCMGHGVFGTPFSGGSGATDNVHTSGAAFVLSQTVANIGSAGAPVTFTPYQPTGTYTTDSPYIVSTYANCFAANYLRELRFISQCAYYKAEPLAYEGGLSNAYGTVLPAGPGAGVPGYYWPFIVSDSNMYKSTVQQYLDWFQLGGSIFCPINTGVGPVAQDAYFLGGGGGWYGNQGWQDTTSVAAKGAIQTDATAITYDPMFGVTTGGTVTQSFPTSYAYTVGMASNSTQVAPQQPLATDMMYGTTGSFVDTYWVIGATQLYTLTVSGSDSAAATCNVYIAAISGNTLLNTGGALSIPVNGAGNTPATVPGNTSSFTHTFTAGNYIIRTQVASGSGNTGLCHLTIAG